MKPAGTGAAVAVVGRLEAGGPPQADTTTAPARSAPSACKRRDLSLGTPPLNRSVVGRSACRNFPGATSVQQPKQVAEHQLVVGDVDARGPSAHVPTPRPRLQVRSRLRPGLPL